MHNWLNMTDVIIFILYICAGYQNENKIAYIYIFADFNDTYIAHSI